MRSSEDKDLRANDLVQNLLKDLVKYISPIKQAIGPFQELKPYIKAYFDEKINSMIEEINADHLSADLFKKFKDINEMTVVLFYFQNSPEETEQIKIRSLLKSLQNSTVDRQL